MDKANQEGAFAKAQKMTLKTWASEFSRYHGLSKRDAIFFNQSDLICDMAKHEDFIVMGRCADVILTNNHIPHISIFITAPFEQRLRRAMELHPGLSAKKAKHLLKKSWTGIIRTITISLPEENGAMPPTMICA